MHIFYEQTVHRRYVKTGKSLLYCKIVVAVLALLFNDRAGDDIFTVQRTESEENKKGFLNMSCDCQ